MSQWTGGETESTLGHHRHVGIFRLHVWGHEKVPGGFSAWAVIPRDGDSNILPSQK